MSMGKLQTGTTNSCILLMVPICQNLIIDLKRGSFCSQQQPYLLCGIMILALYKVGSGVNPEINTLFSKRNL